MVVEVGNAETRGECRDPPPVGDWNPDEQPASRAATPVRRTTAHSAWCPRREGRGRFALAPRWSEQCCCPHRTPWSCPYHVGDRVSDDLIAILVGMRVAQWRRGASPRERTKAHQIFRSRVSWRECRRHRVCERKCASHIGDRHPCCRIHHSEHRIETVDHRKTGQSERPHRDVVDVRVEVRVVMSNTDDSQRRAACSARRGKNPGELETDSRQAVPDTGLVHLMVNQARKHVVEPEIDGHQDDIRMRLEKRDGLGQLRHSGRSTMATSGKKGPCCLARTSELGELETAPSGPLQSQEVVGVARLGRLSLGMRIGGLDTKRPRATQREVVRRVGRWDCSAHRTRFRHTEQSE